MVLADQKNMHKVKTVYFCAIRSFCTKTGNSRTAFDKIKIMWFKRQPPATGTLPRRAPVFIFLSRQSFSAFSNISGDIGLSEI